jgi:hypothetical protein
VTLQVMYKYMAGAGLQANSEGLANAITLFWSQLAKEIALQTDGCYGGPQLAVRTAREWLDRMGYNGKDLKKGVYKDGHERKDVVNYRVSTFLPRIKALEPYMATWIEHPPTDSSLDGSGDQAADFRTTRSQIEEKLPPCHFLSEVLS